MDGEPYFDFMKQAYLVTTRWADRLVEKADGLDEHTKHKAGFYVKQLAGALSPSNFVPRTPNSCAPRCARTARIWCAASACWRKTWRRVAAT